MSIIYDYIVCYTTLGQYVPTETSECKQRCGDVIAGSLLEQESFQAQLPHDVLEARRDSFSLLDDLLKFFEKQS